MGLAPADYVPLDRRFERAAIRDTTDYWAEVLADGEKPRDWTWVREQYRVTALLAQTGSGKTVEFQHQVDMFVFPTRLRSEHIRNFGRQKPPLALSIRPESKSVSDRTAAQSLALLPASR